MESSLRSLSDDDLHAAVRRLTARANVTLADLLAHLGEVEERGIHRARACATLYAYCQYELRMSEDAAFRRAKAARLVHQHPELRGIVARGELHLTGLLMIAPYLGGPRHAEVIERARFRAKREIARLIAEIDPKPEVPARIEPVAPAAPRRAAARAIASAFVGPVRSLPEGDRPADWIDPPPPANVGAASEVADPEQARELAEAEAALDRAWLAKQQARPERSLRFRVQFTAEQEYVDLIEEAFDLLGLGKRAASLPELQLRALREFVERLRQRRTGTKRSAPEAARKTVPSRRPATPARETVTSGAPAALARKAVTAGAPTALAREGVPSRAPAALAREAVTSRAPAALARRHVIAAIRREVWARDAGQCAYTDPRGRRCPETGSLELHHREAHAMGGPDTVDNLELRCPPHNLLAAEQDFGRSHMDCKRGKAPPSLAAREGSDMRAVEPDLTLQRSQRLEAT